ncbi:hypothetical protein RBG61_09130 [Paludicola sp. MB14-C6]|uniref:endo-beta-N-acetylglucosaminidase n=1 Tax=Paludihabitans sp. MB14-C6 TaxID=3070656 RepID=UPI0027DB2660|nr:hypothetical protein [Paludicola sp. MB14-C6]WMJ22162.1 hypothetical protein RBG61_09130 [Paludicola sp. MB14-C6]
MNKKIKKATSVLLTVALSLSMLAADVNIVWARSKEDSDKLAGKTDYVYQKDLGDNQPWVHGYNPDRLLKWKPENDVYSDQNRARVPLQKRNSKFTATQARPNLTAEAQLSVISGNYQTGTDDGWNVGYHAKYGDEFSRYCFNYWQYMDYYGTWNGIFTEDMPKELLDIKTSSASIKYDYGVIYLPNPAYTNAAHKNGVGSLAVIGFSGGLDCDHPYREILEQDANGDFPVANKLIEISKYFGFDGYFINEEDPYITVQEVAKYKTFMKKLRDAGVYIQWYDAIDNSSGSKAYYNEFTTGNSPFIKEGNNNYANSIFLNYWWNNKKLEDSAKHAKSLGLDPLKTVFAGLECRDHFNQGYDIANNKDKNGQPMNGIAFIGSDMPADIGADIGGTYYERHKDENQWKIFERERIWWSGPNQDPTKTGRYNLMREDLGIKRSNWDGVADQIIEKSVINGSKFYTNFNTGHGLKYYVNGEVSNDREWNNINIQDILPSWQWWMDSTSKNKLKVDFNYGPKYDKGSIQTYTQVNPYRGGSSLVVSGKLDAENLLHLYKTDLNVKDTSKFSVTFKKTSTDNAIMKLGLIFKDAPNTVVKVDIPNTVTKSDKWITEQIDLSAYARKEIAAIGLVFDGASNAYQMNVGELKVTDGLNAKPAKPTGLKIDKAYTTNEMSISWNIEDYNNVKQYNVYADINGKETYMGGIYDCNYYIKSLKDAQGIVTIKVKAVGADGVESDAAEVSYDLSKIVQSIKVEPDVGLMNVSWTNPAKEYEKVEIAVNFDYSEDKQIYKITVPAKSGHAAIEIPYSDGRRYTVSISTLNNDGSTNNSSSFSGKLKDSYCEPYDPNLKPWKIDSSSVTLRAPNCRDWFKAYILENGKLNKSDYKLRGNHKLNRIPISDDGTVSIVLENFNGNLSKPTVLDCKSGGSTDTRAIDEKMFPDVVLFEAVKALAPTVDKLKDIKTLDLTGKAVTNLAGISALTNLETLNLANCTNLEMIRNGQLSSNGKLKEIILTGCTSLKAVSFANSTLEKITCEDATKLTNMVSLNMTNAKFDMSEGTPERAFAEAIAKQGDGGKDIILKSNVISNLAKGMTIQPNSTMKNGNYLFDGKLKYFEVTQPLPTEAVIKFDSAQEILSWKLINYSYGRFGLADFEVQCSSDGVSWQTLGQPVVKNRDDIVEQSITNPVAALYYKLIAKKTMSAGSEVREFELYGFANDTYKAGVDYSNQSPVLYSKPASKAIIQKGEGEFDVRKLAATYETIRGTNYTTLKGQSFINPSFDIDKQCAIDTGLFAKVINKTDNSVSYNKIDTSNDATYTVELTTFNVPEVNGKKLGTVTVIVGKGSPVIIPTEPTLTEKVISSINDGTNSNVTVDLAKPETISKDILKAAKEQKKTVTFNVVDSNGKLQYSWTIDGKNVNEIKDVNLELKVSEMKANANIQKAANNENGLVLSFSHSGSLPANTQVKVYVGDQFKDRDKLSFYYFNETKGQLEKIADEIVVKDGYATVTINHCSDYVLTKTEIKATTPAKPTPNTKNPQTGDNAPKIPFVFVVLSGIMLAGISKKSKKTR